ncbi:hypothetical protein [Rhizobium leguminosarum]|uniref:hypothetical protein n=1 Tax=Rhizobium leguminosarum TaxID=384 RepID=UPI00103E1C8E|nr:hypothetical protein [Rhizobium leguminosarum]MBY5798974.1 hypothetical protein [Rhizobium leguminosarum]TBZ15817.1 hypothetical protein E0H33_12965 [Rhizobium leguminosarum bv. viciae]
MELLDGLQQSALIELETLLDDGSLFALRPYFEFLADTAGSQFAAKIGAGITHLYMEALGYGWRANAICLSSSIDPHADFIYDGGNATGHGVVLAEAHGSFAKSVTAGTITSAAKRKYKKQVKPYITATSPFGEVIHGYSIAFGSKPTAAGSFLSVSETRISKPRSKSGGAPLTRPDAGQPGGTPAPIALATHRSNFMLMGVPEVVDWIDWLRVPHRAMPERDPIPFLRLQYAGGYYLTSAPWFWSRGVPSRWIEGFFDHPHWWRIAPREHIPALRPRDASLGWFAIEEKGGAEFLNGLSAAIRSGERRAPPSFALPTFDPVGFGFAESDSATLRARDKDDRAYDYARFRDGLALLGDPFRGSPRDIVFWSPENGLPFG